MKNIFRVLLLLSCTGSYAQNIQNNPGSNHGNKFEQLGTILTTPNEQRTASGAPGVKYWQQRADYVINCELDEKNLSLNGSETVTYFNNSPDPLNYLWLQLDENEHSNINNANYPVSTGLTQFAPINTLTPPDQGDNGYGDKITLLTDALGKKLKYTINKTMMRIDLPYVLQPGQQFVFKVNWSYKISDRLKVGGRGGYEYFPGDGNYLFTMAQWFPRLCVYSDFQGWQNHQFTGRGEFALTFGNYKVSITVPADHVVGATGECTNYAAVLDAPHLARLARARTSAAPVEIVTLAEAKKAEPVKSSAKKTWIYQASNVRDFAWTSSRKFIWDAMGVNVAGKNVLCMSFYGKEAYGLYSKFSTRAVAHTVKTYSHFTIPYPYPVAQSVEAANGMEYPMICFNYGRTESDGTYTEATKYGMLGVVIHEVGHNFFPMIINSDERQHTWMDEGLNSFVQYLTEELWDNKFPTKRGPAYAIIDYMKLPKDELEPIMANSENIVRFGPNAYAKPATALNILRETVMGRELFDFAFKEYSRRWAFKHPTPADFFRTMEDASGEDLDWFWRGWFYGTDACDISIDDVKTGKPAFNPPALVNNAPARKLVPQLNPDDVSKQANRSDKTLTYYTDRDTAARDFYWRYARGIASVDTSKVQPQAKTMAFDALSEAEIAATSKAFYYELDFSNKGGLVMPILVELTFADGSKQLDRIPAQIWRLNENKASKLYILDKELVSVRIDPMRETADIDESNNYWGKKPVSTKFQVFRQKNPPVRGGATGEPNPMQLETKRPAGSGQ